MWIVDCLNYINSCRPRFLASAFCLEPRVLLGTKMPNLDLNWLIKIRTEPTKSRNDKDYTIIKFVDFNLSNKQINKF